MLERDKMLAPHLMMHAKDFIAGRQRAGVGPHSSFPFHFRLKSTITDIAASIKPKDYTVFLDIRLYSDKGGSEIRPKGVGNCHGCLVLSI